MSTSSAAEESRVGTPVCVNRGARSAIRVCHVSMTLLTGGLERLLVEFARHCDRSQFDPQFIALGELGSPAQELKQLGFQVQSLSCGRRMGRLARIRRLAQHFADQQVQIVHTHNTLPHFEGTLAARLAKVPVVLNTQHGRGCGKGWRAKWQFRIANRFADQVVGVSRDATQLCQSDDRYSAERMLPIWNGIDTQRFEFRGPQLKPLAITVARLAPEKDLATLLRAVWIVVRDYPDFRLQIVGDGPERAHLEQLRHELQLEQNVDFLGERTDIAQLLGQAGLYVSSSLSEGVSLTLLEAMSVGLPVVATDVGGNPEVVEDGRTGRLVRSRSPEQLANALRDMLDDRDVWSMMGELGRHRVEQHFDVRQTVRHYEQLYRSCVESKVR